MYLCGINGKLPMAVECCRCHVVTDENITMDQDTRNIYCQKCVRTIITVVGNGETFNEQIQDMLLHQMICPDVFDVTTNKQWINPDTVIFAIHPDHKFLLQSIN